MADSKRQKYSFSQIGARTGFNRLFCFLPLFAAFPGSMLFAQTLQLSSTAASQGTRVVVEISLKSPQGKEPAALQWEATIPTAELNLIDKEIAIGPAAKEAGKSVTCAVKGRTDKTLTSVCILAGGRQQIQNGVRAIFVWGRVDYVDAFKKNRHFIFRCIALGPGSSWPLLPHPDGYEAN